MIDRTKFYFLMTSVLASALRYAQDGVVDGLKIYGNCFYVKNPFGLGSVKVFFDFDKKLIWMETSLPKFLQGHNVFGSNDLEFLCLNAISLVYRRLGSQFTEAEKHLIREAKIRIGRIEATCSFRLDSPEMVCEVLELLYQHLRAAGKQWSAYGQDGIETVYNQQSSTRITDKFYNKGKELATSDGQIPDSVSERDRLIKMASSLLRFEVTIRGKELVSRRLCYAHHWNTDVVKQTLFTRIKQMKLQGILRPKLASDELTELSHSCHAFYRLWAAGSPLGKCRGYRTLDRARQHLLEAHQVDIYRPVKTGCPISLDEVLDPRRAYYSSPSSLVSRGAVFSRLICEPFSIISGHK